MVNGYSFLLCFITFTYLTYFINKNIALKRCAEKNVYLECSISIVSFSMEIIHIDRSMYCARLMPHPPLSPLFTFSYPKLSGLLSCCLVHSHVFFSDGNAWLTYSQSLHIQRYTSFIFPGDKCLDWVWVLDSGLFLLWSVNMSFFCLLGFQVSSNASLILFIMKIIYFV